MNPVTLDPAILGTAADTYDAVADDIVTAATRLDVDGVALAAVFGVIGTDFVGAAQTSARLHRLRVDALATQARHITTRLRAARAGYLSTDDSAARAITATTEPVVRDRVA